MGLSLKTLVNPPFVRPPSRLSVNGRQIGSGLVVIAGAGGVEALTDLVGTVCYRPGLGWLGAVGQLVQIGAAATCILGGWQMYRGNLGGKPHAVYGLATAVVGQVLVAIAGSSVAATAVVVVLIGVAYYLVVISQLPVVAASPAQTIVAVVIAVACSAALDLVLVGIQSSSCPSPLVPSSESGSHRYPGTMHVELTDITDPNHPLPMGVAIDSNLIGACIQKASGTPAYLINGSALTITLSNYKKPGTFQVGKDPVSGSQLDAIVRVPGQAFSSGVAQTGNPKSHLTIDSGGKTGSFDLDFKVALSKNGNFKDTPVHAHGSFKFFTCP